MKGPKRICPGVYEWDVFNIEKIQSCETGLFTSRDVWWNVSVREGYWFGDAGYFDAGYAIESYDTYAEAKALVADLMANPNFKVKYKGKYNSHGWWECDKDGNGDYMIDKEAA